MKHWKRYMIALMFAVGVGTAVMPVADSMAITVFKGCNGKSQAVCKASRKEGDAKAASTARNIINTMLYLLGSISVIMIVVGGIRYTTSAGDASRVKASKDTIMYAVVGIVVALMAFAIVNFVVKKI